MRRSARGEAPASSLFPFLAVLLCTMGAMVVLLVAMAHVSRQRAHRQAEAAEQAAVAARAAADSPERRAAEARLAEAEAVAERLREIRDEGEERLRQEQARLSDIEDHLRRLRDEREELVVETTELVAVEEEHYDDQKVAEGELLRLNELIGELRDEIEEMKHAAAGRQRSYAVVPMRDAKSGTLRPPIYFECGPDGVVLQPEGIEFDWQDLAAPKHSSPITVAARAVVRYYEDHPEARAANELGEPYPLILVRPDGVESYYRARTALELGGVDYGYQPIAEDWPVEYGDPNASVAQRVIEAVELARRERVGLARVIPKLAMQLAQGAKGPPNPRQFVVGSVSGSGGATASAGPGLRVKPADPNANNPFEGLRIEGAPLLVEADGEANGPPGAGSSNEPFVQGSTEEFDTESRGPGSGSTGGLQPGDQGRYGAVAIERPAAEASPYEAAEAEVASLPGVPDEAATKPDGVAGASTATATAGQPGGAPGSASDEASSGAHATAALTAPPQTPGPSAQGGRTPQSGRGGRDKRPGMAVVRSIRLYVADDRVVILSNPVQGPNTGEKYASKQEIALRGPTGAQINEVVEALEKHADSWGIAGQGMYWDPRLLLDVSEDGQRRARELTTLLKAAGLEVQAQPASTAARPETDGGDDATRR